MKLFDLPNNWDWRDLSSVASDTVRTNPKHFPDKTFRYVDISAVDNKIGVIIEGDVRTLKGAKAPSRARKAIYEEDVIVATTRPYLKNIALVPSALNDSVCSTGFCVLRASSGVALPTYLYYACRSDFFINQLIPKQRGASYPAVSDSDVFASKIPIPHPDNPTRSLQEQRRIVARVEALLGELRELRELQEEIGADVGRVMDALRRERFGSQPAADWVPLSTYVERIENGRSPQAQSRPAEGNEWGVLKVGCVTYGYFKPEENKALLPNTEPNPAYEVHDGDFLMSRANTLALVGACAIVRNTPPRLLLSDKTFRFHFKKPIDRVYLDHLLKSPALRYQIERVASGTSPTMKNISKRKVLDLLVPVHEMDEQREIGELMRAFNEEIKVMQASSQSDLALLERAEQAILAQAFRGEL